MFYTKGKSGNHKPLSSYDGQANKPYMKRDFDHHLIRL